MKNLLRFKYNFICLSLIALLLVACEVDYLLYDTSTKDGIYFDISDESDSMIDSLYFAFGVDGNESAEVRIPLELMGMPKHESRSLSYELVDSTTTALETVHYTLGSAQIEQGDVIGYLPVMLYRNNDEMLIDSVYRLTVRLIDNENFRAVINEQVTLYFTDGLGTAPPYYKYFLGAPGTFSQKVLFKFFEYFRALEQINPKVYNALIELYGYNLEDCPNEEELFFGKYEIFLKENILKPMWDYYEANPEERDEVKLSMLNPYN